MKMIMKFNKYYNTLAIITGFLFLCLILWNRLRYRSPYHLNDLEFSSYRVVCTVILIVIFSITFYLNIKKILKINNHTASFIDRLLNKKYIAKTIEFISNAPKNFFEYCYARMSFRWIETPMSHIVAYFYNDKGLLFFALLLLAPLLIISIVFFIEVIFFNEITWFIKTLFLLFIPLTMRAILYISKAHSEKNIEYLKTFVELYSIKGDDTLYIRLYKEYCDKPEQYNLSAISNWYWIYINMRNFVNNLYQKEGEIKPYFIIVYSVLFLISWCYILFYLFYYN